MIAEYNFWTILLSELLLLKDYSIENDFSPDKQKFFKQGFGVIQLRSKILHKKFFSNALIVFWMKKKIYRSLPNSIPLSRPLLIIKRRRRVIRREGLRWEIRWSHGFLGWKRWNRRIVRTNASRSRGSLGNSWIIRYNCRWPLWNSRIFRWSWSRGSLRRVVRSEGRWWSCWYKSWRVGKRLLRRASLWRWWSCRPLGWPRRWLKLVAWKFRYLWFFHFAKSFVEVVKVFWFLARYWAFISRAYECGL